MRCMKLLLGVGMLVLLSACSVTQRLIGKDSQQGYLPHDWTSEKRMVKVEIPEGKESREITYYKNMVGMELVVVPAGEFMMGSRDSVKELVRKCGGRSEGARRFESEHPRHRVRITKPFYMGAFEVTWAQYADVMGKNVLVAFGIRPESDDVNKPVDTVTWNDAAEFCRQLSRREGLAYRLPTEAEWEYGCRAGTTTPFCFGETISTDQANYDGDFTYGSGRKGVDRRETTLGGRFPPNAFGLYDMHGNVWEWCADWYSRDYYSESPVEDPEGPAPGEGRVIRGGMWKYGPENCRSAARHRNSPASTYDNLLGFRVVITTDEFFLPKHAWRYIDPPSDYNGVWTKRHSNGNKEYEANFKDGKRHGTCTGWYSDGQKEYEENYKDGKRHGMYSEWYRNGLKKHETNYKDGEKHGMQMAWYSNGQKMSKDSFEEGKKHGAWIWWYRNGQKDREGNYKNGNPHGTFTFWHENGQKLAEKNFKNGQKHGTWMEWYKSGQKKHEGNYKEGKL